MLCPSSFFGDAPGLVLVSLLLATILLLVALVAVVLDVLSLVVVSRTRLSTARPDDHILELLLAWVLSTGSTHWLVLMMCPSTIVVGVGCIVRNPRLLLLVLQGHMPMGLS